MKILLWPFTALWNLATATLGCTGRLIALTLGLTMLLVGALLTTTVVGAIVGIPMMGLGLLLLRQGLR